jgi:hypothetical protein
MIAHATGNGFFCVVHVDTDRHPTIELLEAVFPVRSLLKLYNVDQLPLRDSLEIAIRRVGGWCEMAASLQVCESGSSGMSTVGRCYPAEQWRLWLGTLVFVW